LRVALNVFHQITFRDAGASPNVNRRQTTFRYHPVNRPNTHPKPSSRRFHAQQPLPLSFCIFLSQHGEKYALVIYECQ
jgi:hypothetical protein